MLKLRQVALITADLQKSLGEFSAVFGISDAYEDPAVREFGLKNAILTLGDTYIELLCPIQASAPAARFLERNGGDGGYMLIFQTDDLAVAGRRVEKLGIRKTWETHTSNARAFHMHPKDTGGPILSFDEMTPAESWAWAGPDWKRRAARFVGGIRAVDVLSARPDELAQRWEMLFERRAVKERRGWVIPLDDGAARIYGAENSAHDGIGAIEVDAYDASAVLAAAARLGVPLRERAVVLCGVPFRLSADKGESAAHLPQ